VDIEGELTEVIKPSSEINSGSLSKMGFTKIGGRWVSKDGDQASPSRTNEADEPKKQQCKMNLLLKLKKVNIMTSIWMKECQTCHLLKD